MKVLICLNLYKYNIQIPNGGGVDYFNVTIRTPNSLFLDLVNMRIAYDVALKTAEQAGLEFAVKLCALPRQDKSSIESTTNWSNYVSTVSTQI